MTHHIFIIKIWMRSFCNYTQIICIHVHLALLSQFWVCMYAYVCVHVFHIFEYNCYRSPWCLGVIGSFIVVIYSVQEWWKDGVKQIENKIPIFNCCFTTGFLATKGDGFGCLFLPAAPVVISYHGLLCWQVHAAIRHCVWGVFLQESKESTLGAHTAPSPNQHHFG